MDVGLVLPSPPVAWPAVVADARRAEELGLASLWLPDPPPGAPPAQGWEPLTALAALARTTSRARLGPLALDGRHERPPGVLAKALSTLDVLSGGRLTVALAPRSDDDRGAQELAEVLGILRRAFTGEAFDAAGRSWTIELLSCRPRPVQRPGPPLWAVGCSDALLAVAAAAADGWAPTPGPVALDDFRQDAARLDDACRGAGRAPASLLRAASAELDGPAGTAAAQMAEWAAAGVAHLVISRRALPFGETNTDDLEIVASAIRLGRGYGKYRSS